MKLGVKSLCAIGALLLCSNDVLAQIVRWEKSYDDGGVSVVIKGPVTESDLEALSNPFVVVRNLTFDGNNLEEFTPKMIAVFKKLTGVVSFSMQNNKLSRVPEWISECFPRLKKIYFWGNSIKETPESLLYNGNLETISGCAPFADNSREGINKNRQLIIDSYKNNIQDAESKLGKMLPEGWDVKRKLQALDGYLRVWESCKFHSEEKKKPLESEKNQLEKEKAKLEKKNQLEAEKVQLAERKIQLEAKIVQLKEAERQAKKAGASKRVKKELSKRVKKANKEIEEITKRVVEITREAGEITEKVEGITVEINNKSGDIEGIGEKIQKIAEEIMPIDLEINQYDSQIEQIEKEKDEINFLQKEIESYRNTLAKLEKAQKISLEIAERENRR